EILIAVKEIIKAKEENSFSVNEVVNWMQQRGTSFAERTIRTHITSRGCSNAPDNHAVCYENFYRIRHGIYKLVGQE
ncbi:DUF7669 domain-containing protein, partial [Zhenhengia yiwuensis]|uniref:DUF7669 domain-containing protein n=1 Tax=Zhenhengia yiwuensis TaxID=2763666 RepID=UPI002A754B80